MQAAASWSADSSERPAVACARPHELEIAREKQGESAIAASVDHMLPIGPIVRVRLNRRDGGGSIEAELSKEQFRKLNLTIGESVFVNPLNIRYFHEDYSI